MSDSRNEGRPVASEGAMRGYAQRIFFAVAIAALAVLAWRLSDLLLLMFGAIIVAVALHALAAPLQTRLGLSPRLAVAAAVLLSLIMLTVGSWLIGDRLIGQLENLRQKIPEAVDAVMIWVNRHPLGLQLLGAWDDAKTSGVPWGRVANVATSTLGALSTAGLMLIVGVYLAADPALYRNGLVRLIPIDYRVQIDGALRHSGQALSRWLLGQAVSMLFVGAATAIGLAALGMPLALSIGVIAGVLAFIPFFGPIASGILAVVLAFMEGPTQALYVAGLCLLIQQVEGNLLMPFVQKWAVELPPVLGIIAAVIFGLLFGITGIIFATPLMVVAMVLIEKLYIEGVLESKQATA